MGWISQEGELSEDGIVFMTLDEARFITGHVLNVDGFHTAN